jgi:hypothetical protein
MHPKIKNLLSYNWPVFPEHVKGILEACQSLEHLNQRDQRFYSGDEEFWKLCDLDYEKIIEALAEKAATELISVNYEKNLITESTKALKSVKGVGGLW